MINTAAAQDQIPTLSIIIATYNASKYINDCLDSIAKNIPNPFELIIIDGKSQDDTLNIIRRFETLNPKIISEPDRGIYDAMNKGTELATGKWILFLGADDRVLPSFKKILPYMSNSNSIYYGNCVNGEKKLGGHFSNYKLAKMNLCHQAILYPNAVFKKYKFDLKYPVFADYLLNFQCWGDVSFAKTYVNIDLAYYHMEGFSSIAEDPDFKRDKPALIKKHLSTTTYLRYKFRKFKESRKPGSRFF